MKPAQSDSLKFRLWQGDIEDPITDNRFIGTMKIAGTDFPNGVIAKRAALKCVYKVRDSGHIHIAVNVPSIQENFIKQAYSTEEGKIDYTASAGRTRVADEVRELRKRIDDIGKVVDDSRLRETKQRLKTPAPHEEDAERWLNAHARVWEAKRLIAKVRKERLKEFHQIALTGVVSSFEEVRRDALPVEVREFDTLKETAQRALDHDEDSFEEHLDELERKDSKLHWRQDWYVIELFRQLEASPPDRSADRERFNNLVESGNSCLSKGIPLDPADAAELRTVAIELGYLLYDNSPLIDNVDIYL